MTSRFRREADWYLGNIALFLVLAFAILVGSGFALLGFSSDEAVAHGQSGVFPVRVL